MDDRVKWGVCSMLLELGKRKSADHLTLCRRKVCCILRCLLKNGAALKECKGDKGQSLRGWMGAEPFTDLKQSEASLKSILDRTKFLRTRLNKIHLDKIH